MKNKIGFKLYIWKGKQKKEKNDIIIKGHLSGQFQKSLLVAFATCEGPTGIPSLISPAES